MSEIKTRNKSKKRSVILDGAIDVFISVGYELASMDKIAETAGVSKRTVYNHFGSKENLFQVVLDDFLSQRQNLKNITYDPNKTLAEQLLAFAHAEIFLIKEPRHLGLSRFLTITFLKDISYAREMVGKYPPNYNMLLEWLKLAKEDGRIVSENLFITARVFYSLVEGAITWPALFNESLDQMPFQPLLNEIIDVFLAKYKIQRSQKCL